MGFIDLSLQISDIVLSGEIPSCLKCMTTKKLAIGSVKLLYC